MAFFWKKQETIEKMISRYFERCDTCFELFEKAFASFVDSGQSEAFDAAVGKTHDAESAADDLRREVELTLYGKALLPESRGDILGLLESFDRLPNRAETVLFAMRCQRMVIPAAMLPSFKELVAINLKAYYALRKAVDDLFNNPRITLHSTKEVDEIESTCDRLERDIICGIFDNTELDTGTKVLLRDLVLVIGSISDRAEEAADRIGIVAIKRQI